jgi:hypothetical protein
MKQVVITMQLFLAERMSSSHVDTERISYIHVPKLKFSVKTTITNLFCYVKVGKSLLIHKGTDPLIYATDLSFGMTYH